MSRDDDKLLFSSAWETDQIYEQGETEVTLTGSATLDTTVATFNFSERPWMDCEYKVGSGAWYKPGGTTASFDQPQSVAAYWKTTTTSAVVGLVNGTGTSRTVTIRYRIYTDLRE